MADCNTCTYYEYDEEFEEYFCSANMDEDDVMRLYTAKGDCPFFRLDDEYAVVRKQN